MVKTPRARHSSRKKEPVTIELGPDQVSRLSDPAEPAAAEAMASRSSHAWEGFAAPAGDERTGADADPAEDQSDDRIGTTASSDGTYYTTSHDAPSPDAASSAPAAPHGGFGRSLAAGVAGGVIALLLAGGLQWAGFIPMLGNAADDNASPQSLRADVDALEQRVASLGAGALDAQTVKRALAPVGKRMDQLTADLDKVKTDAATARPAGGSADTTALKSVQDRLATLEQSVAAAGKALPSTQTVDALGQKVDALDQAAAGNSAELQKLQERVTALSGKFAERASEPNATAAIAASTLKSAIERGGSFAAELDTFAAVAPDTPELGQLRALAAKGVPTRAQLSAEVGAVADGMLDATQETSSSEAGVVDRLLASARSLVKVHPVGTVQGNGAAARIARFRNAVTGGDLAGAAEEYNALPDKAKAAGAEFMAKLQARLKIDALAQKALASALKTG